MIWSCDFIFWAERSIQSSSEGRPECRMQYHCHGTDKSQCTQVSASSLPVSVAGVGRASDPFLPFPVSVWTYVIPTAVTSLFILTLAWRSKPLSETPSSVRVGVLRRLPLPHFLSRKGVTLRLDSSKLYIVIYRWNIVDVFLQIIILCDLHQFRVSVDGIHQLDYKHRVSDLKQITEMEVLGDIQLLSSFRK